PDGRRVATFSDNVLRVWDADGEEDPLLFTGHVDPITSLSWSPDGKRILTGSKDKTVRVWNADGAGEPRVLSGHEAAVDVIGWSPDGRRLVAFSDNIGRVWSAD